MKINISPMKIINFVIYSLIVFFSFVIISSYVNLPGGFRFYSVMSGSMEPKIKSGSIILVRKLNTYKINDVITFQQPEGKITTHRIVNIEESDGSSVYRVKGDANDTADPYQVTPAFVLGKTLFSVPGLGYLLNFLKTPLGVTIFLVIPGTIIIYEEFRKIINEIKKQKAEREEKKIVKSIFILLILITFAFGTAYGIFSSQTSVTNNQFSTGYWPMNIVINEVYYNTNGRTYPQGQGTKTEEEGKNEWIELYNPNSFAVNIKNYKIGSTSQEFTINPNISIPAYGFVLLSHDNSTWHFWGNPSGLTINLSGSVSGGWLSNTGDWVYLKNANNNLIDQMSYGTNIVAFSPPCPNVAEGHSLERNPDGYDINSKNDFLDRVTPTPGY